VLRGCYQLVTAYAVFIGNFADWQGRDGSAVAEELTSALVQVRRRFGGRFVRVCRRFLGCRILREMGWDGSAVAEKLTSALSLGPGVSRFVGDWVVAGMHTG
jgi:hypothetical protein